MLTMLVVLSPKSCLTYVDYEGFLGHYSSACFYKQTLDHKGWGALCCSGFEKKVGRTRVLLIVSIMLVVLPLKQSLNLCFVDYVGDVDLWGTVKQHCSTDIPWTIRSRVGYIA